MVPGHKQEEASCSPEMEGKQQSRFLTADGESWGSAFSSEVYLTCSLALFPPCPNSPQAVPQRWPSAAPPELETRAPCLIHLSLSPTTESISEFSEPTVEGK